MLFRRPLTRFSPVLLALALLLLVPASSPADPDGVQTMPSSELRPGMRGYGLTVFKGTQVTRFPITVLGVARGHLSGSDMVLIRVDGGHLVEQGIGIVAGMSGSPVYVQERLIGAISYGWGFSKVPIGGVTPIHDMMAELPGPLPPAFQPPPWGAVGRLETPLTLEGRTYREVRISPKPEGVPGPALELSPLGTLLQTSGLDQGAIRRLNQSLKNLPVQAVQGFQGQRPQSGIPTMVPGSAVGVPLLTGDIEVAATGTLTWRKGNSILAFGHPLAQLGEVNLPLSAAYIHTVLPSYQMSFKMASQLGLIGEMSRDRLWAIGGRLHAPVSMLPVRLVVHDTARGKSRTWNLRAAQQRYLTPAVLSAATSYTVGHMSADLQASTARLSMKIQPQGQAPLDLEDLVTGAGLADRVANHIESVLSRLLNNSFQPLRLESVQIEATIVPRPLQASIERIYSDRTEYHPGETVRLGLVLKPYDQASQVRELTLALPRDARPGKVKIGVAARGSLPELLQALTIQEPAPSDLPSLLNQLQQETRGGDLAVRMVLPGQGLRMGPHSLPLLPASWRQALGASNQSHLTSSIEVLRSEISTPWALRGKALLEVELKSLEAPVEPKHQDSKPPSPVADLPTEGHCWTLKGSSPGGEFLGAALDATGALTAGPPLESLWKSSDELILSLADGPGEALLAGMAGNGQVLRLLPGREATVFGHTGSAAVLSLVRSGGGIWGGTAPEGSLVRWDLEGRPTLRVRLPGAYVWALTPAPEGGVYAAMGLPGSVYLVEASGRMRTLWNGPAQHVRGLALLRDGRLLVATSQAGRLLRLDPTSGKVETLFHSPSPDLEAVAISGPHAWVATEDSLYRVPLEAGAVQRFTPGPCPTLCLMGDGEGGVWAGQTDGSIARVPASGEILRVPASSKRPVLALLAEEQGVLAARSFPVEILRLGQGLGRSEYLSPVLDAGAPSRWGQIRWLGVPGTRSPAALRTRSGPTSAPDEHWSPWSETLGRSTGANVPSPPDRFLQVGLRLEPDPPTPLRIQSLQVGFSALPGPLAVHWVEPQGSERWSGARTLKWRLAQGDPSRVSCDVEISSDGGVTWTSLISNRPFKGRDETLELNSSRFGDGTHRLRLAAWDRQAPSATRVEALSGAFLLANAKARISWLSKAGAGSLRGRISLPVAAVREVHFRHSSSAGWLPATPVDGLFDSNLEEFELPAGKWTRLEIRVKDEAGNETTVPGPSRWGSPTPGEAP
jgi:hypothetical protein